MRHPLKKFLAALTIIFSIVVWDKIAGRGFDDINRDRPKLNVPPLKQKTHRVPEVFGPGVLSVGEVYRGSFAPDGRTFYFFKKVTKGKEDYRIFVSRLTGGKWTTPEPVHLGGEFSDLYPSLSKDGRRMVFSSYRPVPGAPIGKANAHLWYTVRKGNRWGEPIYLDKANTLGSYHSWAEFGPGDAIYFRRITPDWKSSVTLVSRWDGKEYAAPESYHPVEQWKNWREDLSVRGGSPSRDGKMVFLDIARKDPQTGRLQSSDIWVSRLKGRTWTEPRELSSLSTPGFETFVFFSPDGRELYFVRDFSTFYRIPLKEVLKHL